jgi:hypothetical protein
MNGAAQMMILGASFCISLISVKGISGAPNNEEKKSAITSTGFYASKKGKNYNFINKRAKSFIKPPHQRW